MTNCFLYYNDDFIVITQNGKSIFKAIYNNLPIVVGKNGKKIPNNNHISIQKVEKKIIYENKVKLVSYKNGLFSKNTMEMNIYSKNEFEILKQVL